MDANETTAQATTDDGARDQRQRFNEWKDEAGKLWVAVTGRKEFWFYGEPIKVIRYVRLERARLCAEFVIRLVAIVYGLALLSTILDELSALRQLVD